MELSGDETKWENTPTIAAAPFCRGAELQDMFSVIGSRECRAVFLTSDRGLGASTILRQVMAQAHNNVPVILIHGSASLYRVPFGVLAQYTVPSHSGHPSIKMSVLHALLAEIELLRQHLSAPVPAARDTALIVIDNAHFLDAATADLLVDLVMSGTVSIVASHWSRRTLPAPLPKLWTAGVAENIILAPLTLPQVRNFCEAVLGGPLQQATGRYFHLLSGGNPQLLQMLLTDAATSGQFLKRRGHWFMAQPIPAHGRALQETVTLWLSGLSEGGLAALRLIALAEPVAEPVVREMFGAAAVRELRDWQLLRHNHGESEELSLLNPLYGDIIRDMTPIGQSRQLYQEFTQWWEAGISNKATLLRRVTWAMTIGANVSEELILQAAVFAGSTCQSTTALHLASAIESEPHRIKADVVRARAKFDLGDYQGAFEHVEIAPDEARNLPDLLCGSLLRSAIQGALGMPVQTLEDDAQALRKGGERLSLAHPGQADHILKHSRKSALLVTLMALSRKGRHSEMLPLAMVLAQAESPAAAPGNLCHTFAMAMDAERLTAQGYPLQATVRAGETFAIKQPAGSDFFFLTEFIMLRHVLAAVSAGEWDTAAAVLERFAQETGSVVHAFASMENVFEGMVAVRRGADSEALELLLTGIDALQISDPQQLLGFCTAMAAYAAATLGRTELAWELVGEHVESTGMFTVLFYERAYLAAARHLLNPDGDGLGELLVQADAAYADNSTMLELHALALLLELGEESVALRVQGVAAGVEGPWARAIGVYAQALQPNNSATLGVAAETLAGAGLLGLARQALHRAAGQRDTKTLRSGTGLPKSRYPQPADPAMAAKVAGSDDPATTVKLTRREHEVTRLAAAGMSDRHISQTLKVALRTVEGHLYRAYAKLGVSTREELSLALSQLPPNT